MARPRFIADADLNEKIVTAVLRREPTIDLLNAAAGGTRGLSDPEVLALGAASNRIVVSSDRKKMPTYFAAFRESHDSPGLIIVPQSVPVARAIEELILIWAHASPEQLRNCVKLGEKKGLTTPRQGRFSGGVERGIKSRALSSSLFVKLVVLNLALLQIFVDCGAIGQVICQRAEDLFERQRLERVCDAFRRVATEKRVHDGVQGHTRARNIISAVSVLHVLHGIEYTVLHLSFWFPPVNRSIIPWRSIQEWQKRCGIFLRPNP